MGLVGVEPTWDDLPLVRYKVQAVGLEPTNLAAVVFETTVFTNFTTLAWCPSSDSN
jgi:hypothetical protein